MLKDDITEKRKARHSITQEDFTPEAICEILCNDCEELFKDFSKTYLDPCSGTGNIIVYILKKRLKYCNTNEDVYNALKTIYGTELMKDNVEESYKNILYNIMLCTSKKHLDLNESIILDILHRNIVCTDTFKWNYEEWRPYTEEELKQIKKGTI